MDLQKVGRFIAEHRKIKKLTQDKLGEQLGVNGKTISKWERGVNAPDISVLNRLSEILEVNVSEILNGEKNMVDENNKNDKIIDKITYYAKKERRKYIKLFINIILIILVTFTILFTLNNYNKFKVYSIESKDEKYFIEGLIISNQERNLMIIKNIDLKDKYIGTELEEKIKNIKISIIGEKKNIFSLVYETDGLGKPINEFLINRTYFSDEDINSNENIISKNTDINNLKLKIEYTNTNNISSIIIVPLEISEDYSNNKIIY